MALLVALLCAAWPMRGALLDGERVFFGVESVGSFLPWSGVLPPGTVANPDLVDQTEQFYPFYRWVSRSWRGGDPPLWCPDIYAGAPGVGNAQSGALDPQVLLLVALEALGGPALFDHGLALAAWLRLAIALSGAYFLARRLGLGRAGAALAGVTFGYSGYLLLWLNHALGHVPPFLPWVLFLMEGLRHGRRPALGVAGVALSMALSILGGHLETAFFVGATAGLWALALLREDRGAGLRGLAGLTLGTLAAAASLLPSYEYLGHSAAKFVRELGAAEARAAVDLFALGLLVVLGALVLLFRRVEPAAEEPGRAGRWVPAVLGLGLAFAGCVLLWSRRGLEESARLALVPELLGKPGHGAGYQGAGYYLEVASPWIAFTSLAFCLVTLLRPSGPLRRRGLCAALGALAFLLSIELPGLLDLYRFVPLVGLGDTVRFASVGALLLGLLAGEGLERSTPAARTAAALVLSALLALLSQAGGVAPLDERVPVGPETDELVTFVRVPARHLAGERAPFEGWLHAEVPADRARLVLERIDATGSPFGEPPTRIPVPFLPAPTPEARAALEAAGAPAPEGARWFRTPFLLSDRLADGHWRATFELFRGPSPEPIARRRVGVSSVERGQVVFRSTVVWISATLLLLVLPLAPRALRWGAVLLAAGQAASFSEGLNPSVPRERVFPPTRTEEILRAELGPYRFFTDPGVMPPNTGLVRGLRAIEGYDAMDVAAFNHYRNNVFPAGFNTLFAWNARGVDLDNVAFRLYGVGMLVLAGPLDHPRWELAARPEHPDPARRAEAWLYRARDPVPRAFCVPRVVSTTELGVLHQADPTGWDPLAVAGIEGAWRPERPFTQAEVGVPRFTNNGVTVRASLDGDGLLVLTDQVFPGWTVLVDGEERPLETANQIFRGVALGAGEHEVVFRYASPMVRAGAWTSALAAGAILALVLVGLAQRPSGSPASSSA